MIAHWVKGAITTEMALRLAGDLKGYNGSLHVDSHGGNWWGGKVIGAAVGTYGIPVIVHDIAASAAAYVAICSPQCFTKPTTRWSFHNVARRGGAKSDAQRESLADALDTYASTIFHRSKLSEEDAYRLLREEHEFDGATAVRYGLADYLLR